MDCERLVPDRGCAKFYEYFNVRNFLGDKFCIYAQDTYFPPFSLYRKITFLNELPRDEFSRESIT